MFEKIKILKTIFSVITSLIVKYYMKLRNVEQVEESIASKIEEINSDLLKKKQKPRRKKNATA